MMTFKELRTNKELLIKKKKSEIYKSYNKGVGVKAYSLKINANKGLDLDDLYYYIAVNTTNILDSHSDLHVKGIWNKTVKEQQGKNYLLTDHKMMMSHVVAKKEDIEMLLMDIPFSALGKNLKGNTEALVYKVLKSNIINHQAKEWLDSGKGLEASVRMQYVNVMLAMNSNDDRDREEKKNFDTYYKEIANREEFEEIDYFWVVKEAKNLVESSLVLQGSSNATGKINAATSTSEDEEEEPSIEDTQEKSLKINRRRF